MKREAYRTWLAARGATSNAVNTRSSALARIERVMEALGLPDQDLDVAWERDQLAGARQALSALVLDAKEGGETFRILLPQSEKPINRLQNYRAWLGQYGAFRHAETVPERVSDWPELEEMRREFLRRASDFVDFTQTDGTFFEGERDYKDRIRERISKLVASKIDDEELGKQAIQALMPQNGPILQWQNLQLVNAAGAAPTVLLRGAIGRQLRLGDPAEGMKQTIDAIGELRIQHGVTLTKGATLNIAVSFAGFARPDFACPFKIEKARQLAKRLGVTPLSYGPVSLEEIHEWLGLAQRVFAIMRDVWGWQPKDLFDVQGFAWMVLDDGWKPIDEEEDDVDSTKPKASSSVKSLNTILYGPPGTGKTWATRRHAVSICDGEVAANALNDDQLGSRYEALRLAGRIGFVTFHQSFSYEDFVEGLRPEVEEVGAGFGLVARPGILREMAELAAKGRTAVSDAEGADRIGKRGIFKMSLGRANVREDAPLFEECIENNYLLLGYGSDLDWSSSKYSDRSLIRSRLNAERSEEKKLPSHESFLNTFRNEARIGDLVIVTNGNNAFRAIGEITGPYEYRLREEDEYHHRRAVRWLWHEGILPANQIIDGRFMQKTIYRIGPDRVKREALAAYISPPALVEHPPFVLIIDEINRANISKVFGEMITLLEEDKRAGATNAVTLRLPYSGDDFSVPSNLHILGTMNTADRSIALLDTALRRRFQFIETPPQPALLQVVDGIDLALLLTRLNERIEYLFDRDHLIGHAFFMECRDRRDIDSVMRRKIIPLLAEYFHEDWERIIAILGGTEGFIRKGVLPVPPGLEEEGEARYRYSLHEPFLPDAYDGLQA